jgi:hypothetical protein
MEMNYWVKLILCLSLIYTLFNGFQQLHHVVKGDLVEHEEAQLDKFKHLSSIAPGGLVQSIGISVFSVRVLIVIQLLILVALS